MTDAEGESALESTASCGWRCAVQARFGVGIIVLVDITVGSVKRGSFAQRVLIRYRWLSIMPCLKAILPALKNLLLFWPFWRSPYLLCLNGLVVVCDAETKP